MAKQAAKPKEQTIIAYKAFDPDWKCKGFQYEIGKTYTHDGEISLCNSGFHACEAPLDVWNYYPITAPVAQVELGGVSDEKRDDTKRVGKSITIKAALAIPALIAAQIEWTFANTKDGNKSSGYYSKAASSGDSSTAASSGDYSTAASSGDSSTAASSGYYSTAASSGNYSTAASSGYYSKAASSGYYSKAASSGYYSTAASSGDSSTAASSGNYSTAASSGYYSTAACDTNGFACVAGINGSAKGNAGSALSLGFQDAKGQNRFACAVVGEDGIEPNVWYSVDNAGKFVKTA